MTTVAPSILEDRTAKMRELLDGAEVLAAEITRLEEAHRAAVIKAEEAKRPRPAAPPRLEQARAERAQKIIMHDKLRQEVHQARAHAWPLVERLAKLDETIARWLPVLEIVERTVDDLDAIEAALHQTDGYPFPAARAWRDYLVTPRRLLDERRSVAGRLAELGDPESYPSL